MTIKRDRVLILHSYPPTPCLYGFEKGLRELGHEVVAIGPITRYGDPAQFKELAPERCYNEVAPNASLDDIFHATGFTHDPPDWIMYMHPSAPFLPSGLRECPVPTVGWLTEEVAMAHVDEPLYRHFDLAPTAFQSIADEALKRGLDNRPHFNFIGMTWLPGLGIVESGSSIGGSEANRDIDVAFIGTIMANVVRERSLWIEKLRRLRRSGIKVFAHEGIFLGQMLRIYQQSKIVFQHGGQMDSLTFRVGEAMSAGALLLAHRPSSPVGPLGGIEDFRLVEGKHLVYFDTFDEAEVLIRHYLAHEDERREIAEAGRRLVCEEFPYQRQVERFVEDLVHQIPPDYRARREARFVQSREGLDRARYFMASGQGSIAQHLIESDSNWHKRSGDLVQHAISGLMAKEPASYERDLRAAAVLRPGDLGVLFNHALILFSSRIAPGIDRGLVTSQVQTALDLLSRKPADAFEDDEVESIYPNSNLPRFSHEFPRVFWQYPRGPERRRRLVELFRFQAEHCMAVLCLEAGRWADAIQHAENALAFVEDDGYSMLIGARALEMLGRRTDAICWCERAVRAEPFFVNARMDLVRLLLRAAESHRAAEVLDDTLTIYLEPDEVRLKCFLLLVAAHVQAGELGAAKQALANGTAELRSGRIADPGHPIEVTRAAGQVTESERTTFEVAFLALSEAVTAWEWSVLDAVEKMVGTVTESERELNIEPC